jgi:hypothetical protein
MPGAFFLLESYGGDELSRPQIAEKQKRIGEIHHR